MGPNVLRCFDSLRPRAPIQGKLKKLPNAILDVGDAQSAAAHVVREPGGRVTSGCVTVIVISSTVNPKPEMKSAFWSGFVSTLDFLNVYQRISSRRYAGGNELDKMLTHVVAMKRELEENSVMNQN